MLTLQDLKQLAESHGLEIRARYPAADGLTPSQPTSVIVWFEEVCVEAWRTLMTNLTEMPVSIYGTRMSTGSGATDGTLYPAYAAALPDVNVARAAIGLGRISN